jgi:biopolymer transport protein ExbB/TolQ
LAAGLAAAFLAAGLAAAFFAGAAALAAAGFFLAAVAIFSSPSSGMGKFTHKFKTRPALRWTRRIIHRHKQDCGLR